MQRVEDEQILADLKLEARETIDERILRMEAILAKETRNLSEMQGFRREAHSIKGIGYSFGLPAIAAIAHRLEDYISDMTALPSDQECREIQQILDCLQDVAGSQKIFDTEQIRLILRQLPQRQAHFDLSEIEVRDVEIMVVSPTNAVLRFIRQELVECGYRVTVVARPLEALELALSIRPDLMVVSAVLEGMSGIDLICGIKAMPITRKMQVALLTSMKQGDPRLADLPADVPILRKDASFPDDVAELLVRLRVL